MSRRRFECIKTNGHNILCHYLYIYIYKCKIRVCLRILYKVNNIVNIHMYYTCQTPYFNIYFMLLNQTAQCIGHIIIPICRGKVQKL